VTAHATEHPDIAGIDVESVSRWLSRQDCGLAPPYRFELISGGRSNLTYRVVDAAGTEAALRRPPLGHVLATAHDMAREHRILTAVWGTEVPVARPLALCTDVDVNGAPFYVMSFARGTVCHDVEVARTLTPAQRGTAGHSLVEVLAALHALDPDEVGLGDLGRRTGYVERQLKRWTAQWESSKTREVPLVDAVRDRLAALAPPEAEATIAHGDYRIGNCALGADGSIVAVFDWELCTLGDPRADIGYLCSWWPTPAPPGEEAICDLEGFPDRAELAASYAERTGRGVETIDYFTAFSHWRLACIGQGVYARFLHGAMGDQDDVDLDQMRDGVERRARAAADLLGLDA